MKKKQEHLFYTCPMDPDVVQKGPGTCPKCGMHLEPMQQNLERHEHSHGHQNHDSQHNHQNHHTGHEGMEESFKKRFFLGLPLTFIVLLLSPQIQEWLHFSIQFPGMQLVLFFLTSVIVWYLGWPFYQMAQGEIQARKYGMMTLVSLAVLSGYFFSVAATFLFEGESLYWEVSTLVLAFLLGHWIEMRAVRGASGALKELAKLIPSTAHLVKGKKVMDVKTSELNVGDIILVKPGEKVPIDGEVIDGVSSVNESLITGESKPVEKRKGSEVIGGSINADGSLTIKVTKVGEQTVIAQMMQLVQQAQSTRPAVQVFADRAAGWLTFTAIFVGIGTFLFWFLISPQGAVFAATLAISVVVITCPHALGLAIPTVTTIATALAARNNILIRDMRGVERAKNLSYVVFDKTGTLTEGVFGVTQVVPLGKIKAEKLLAYAAAVEYHSQHPIASAVVAHATEKKITVRSAKQFLSFPGKGAEGIVDGKKITVGNKILMKEQGIVADSSAAKEQESGTTVWVAEGKKVIGMITVADSIRKESYEAIQKIKDLGIKTAMLTGDNQSVAKSVAKQLGIDTFFAEVLPEQKVAKIKELQQEGQVVAMVGDGVNDAPSLVQAHVGIAIGAGTAVAIESAEIVLMKNDPRDVVKVIQLSNETNRKMTENVFYAAGYNIIAIPLAAGVLYPSFGILLRPEWSALLMSASSVLVVFNALRLRRAAISV